MMGAIVGDIVGSVYEWHNTKTKDFPLFRDDCFFTDDTVMTCAVAEAVMNGGERYDFIDAMKKYGRMYPDAGYGGRFGSWITSPSSNAAVNHARFASSAFRTTSSIVSPQVRHPGKSG